MKVCPTCQASFAEGFVYCPHDHTELERFDLRGTLRRRQQRELNLLLPTLTFTQRLQREIGFALQELRRHPWLFLKELLRGEGSPRQRVYLLQSGAALAVIAYTFIVTALILFGVSYGIPGEQIALAKPPKDFDNVQLIMPVVPLVKTEFTRGRNGHLGGSLPQPIRAGGGGSGGRQELTPASAGAAPMAALQPQIVLPSPQKPLISNASLVVTAHVVADPKSVISTAGRLGLSDAPPSPPSSGTGTGGGIGNQHGTGVGDKGDGAGYKSGYKWNTGNGEPIIGGTPTTGTGKEEGIPMASGSMRPTILYREKARYTEEARQQQIQGTVILVATFTADGRIINIRSLKGLPAGLTEEAVRAAQRIRFNPALKNGVAVTVQARLEFNFNLY